jgi:hypothetical protein
MNLSALIEFHYNFYVVRKFKHFIVNKPAFFLNEDNYFTYILFLSRIFALFLPNKYIKYKLILPFENSKINVWQISKGEESSLYSPNIESVDS